MADCWHFANLDGFLSQVELLIRVVDGTWYGEDGGVAWPEMIFGGVKLSKYFSALNLKFPAHVMLLELTRASIANDV
jgi:hypothetical protein